MCLPLKNLKTVTLSKGVHRGFEWQTVYNSMGSRCGYIRVEPGHPWFEKRDVEPDVHGGITFAKHGKPCPTHGAEAEWWMGFDCAHANDAPDPSLPSFRILSFPPYPGTVMRTQEFVEAECRALCEQAAEAALVTK